MREAKEGERAVRRLLLLVWEMHTVHVEMHAWEWLVLGSAGLG